MEAGDVAGFTHVGVSPRYVGNFKDILILESTASRLLDILILLEFTGYTKT